MKKVQERLEVLLEKALNKKGYKCPDCLESAKWKYAGYKMLGEKREPIYDCLGCDNTFYHKYLKLYNDSRTTKQD